MIGWKWMGWAHTAALDTGTARRIAGSVPARLGEGFWHSGGGGGIESMRGVGHIPITGPEVIRSVAGEQIDMEGLGGCQAHGKSGGAHIAAGSAAAPFIRAHG